MVTRRGDDRDGAVDPGRSGEPFAPLVVVLGAVDQIAGVQREGGARRFAEGLAKHAGPVRAEIVLGVAEVDERERRRLAAGGAEVEPFAPVDPIAHAVGVEGVGCESGEFDGVVVGRTEVALEAYACGGVVLASALGSV